MTAQFFDGLLIPLTLFSGVVFAKKPCASDPTTWYNNSFLSNCDSEQTYSGDAVTSAAECCAKCADNSANGQQCRAWVYQAPGQLKPGQGWACKLCAGNGDEFLEPQAGAVSWSLSSLPTVPPTAPPTAPPPQPPPRAGAPNIIFLLTDDQDLRLGSMRAMPYTREVVLASDHALNLTNFFINTPICCPSRATMLSGRANHNNKATTYAKSGGGVTKDGMCMRMNTSQTLNPGFWQHSFVKLLHDTYGYQTAMIGKGASSPQLLPSTGTASTLASLARTITHALPRLPLSRCLPSRCLPSRFLSPSRAVLNDMTDYGCTPDATPGGGDGSPSGVDRSYIMCKHVFYNETWIDKGAPDSPPSGKVNVTGATPDEYTTSLIGNTTMRWLKSIFEGSPPGTDSDTVLRETEPSPSASAPAAARRPFFVWIGPHAPHLPSTPASWYLDHPVGELPLVKTPNWGQHGGDKHAFYPTNDPISAQDETGIMKEAAKRLRSMLSVDDIVKAIREYLITQNEWSNTWMFFSSDHGYNLGGFRVDTHKMQVYDHCSRIPFVAWGPNLRTTETDLKIPTSYYDFAPTLLELAKGAPLSQAEAEAHDGTSFASWLTGGAAGKAPSTWTRDAVLIEYQSISGGPKNRISSSEEAFNCDANSTRQEECLSAYGVATLANNNQHVVDGVNNSYSALRWVRPFGAAGTLLYAEFTDVDNPAAWDFDPSQINFHELYNMTADPFALVNIYETAEKSLVAAMQAKLRAAIKCKGKSECEAAMVAPKL